MGDSKTAPGYGALWETTLAAATVKPIVVDGLGGETMVDAAAAIDAKLAAIPATSDPSDFLLNWGTNDTYPDGWPVAEATFTNATLSVIDAIHAAYPSARIWLARVWNRAYATACDTVDGWIDNAIAARPGVAFAGPDERVTLKAGDDGWTNTIDGLHPNAAGNLAWAAAWQTVLGY